jgi:hypothetical protein
MHASARRRNESRGKTPRRGAFINPLIRLTMANGGLATIAKDLNDKTKARTGTSFMNGLTSVVKAAGSKATGGERMDGAR